MALHEAEHQKAPSASILFHGGRRRGVAVLVVVALVTALAVAVWALDQHGNRGTDAGNHVSISALEEMDAALRIVQRGEERVTGAFLADPLHASPDASGAFTEDIVWEDWGVRFVGIDEVLGLLRIWAAFAPRSVDRDRYVGLSGGVVTDATWNMFGWTKDEPGGGIYELGIRDGRLASVLTLLELDVLTPETASAMNSALDPALVRETRTLPAAYARAWSSGDEATIAALYTETALREDEVFGRSQRNRDEIGRFGAQFQGWYPSARFTVARSYGVGAPAVPGRPVTGVELRIEVPARSGAACTVEAAVMLETKGGRINRERVYYQPASLIACGWARA